MRFAKVHVFRERFIEGSGFNIGSPFMAHWIKKLLRRTLLGFSLFWDVNV